MRYLIWHKFDNKVAVNLSGKPLDNLAKEEADLFLGMIHSDIRHMVEIRPMSKSLN